MNINKQDLVDIIYQKLNSAIEKKQIYSVISVISEYLLQEIEAQRPVSVENFGTFSPYMYHSHSGLNVATGELRQTAGFLTVKFRPHVAFLEMIARQREKYRDP